MGDASEPMDVAAVGVKPALSVEDGSVITAGHYAIVQKIGGEHIRVMRFTPKQNILIEKLKFQADASFGAPFGLFEVSAGKLQPVCAEKIVQKDGVGDIELRTEAQPDSVDENTNVSVSLAHVNPEESIRQKLTEQQIQEMKASGGATTGELVAKLVEGNASFAARTVYAQSKYIRRKTKKHSDRVLILKPTIRLLAESYYRKDADRLGNLRIDQLGQLLHLSGVNHGRNVAVFEQQLGLITSACVERLAGKGVVVHLHRGTNAQSIPCLHSMNYSEQVLSTFKPLRITTLLHGVTEEGEYGEGEKRDGRETSAEDAAVAAARKAARLHNMRHTLALVKGPEAALDAVIVGCRTVDPVSVLEELWEGLRPCGTVTVYSPLVQHALDAQVWLRGKGALNVQMSDQMYRVHQVLPDRTHPLMSQMVVGGYIVHGIKVIV